MLVHGISPERITARLQIATRQPEIQRATILATLAPSIRAETDRDTDSLGP
jgi:hypothetical protein